MLTLFIRTLIVYFLMFAVLRLMGKRQISDMQPFDLAVTLLIANLASLPMADPAIPLLYGVIPILVLFLLHKTVARASLKSERIRRLVCGSPLVVIDNGVLCETVMRAANYNISDLVEQLRLKDVFSLSRVEYAILETNGSLSVVLKGEERPPSVGDLGLEPSEECIAELLIMDGKLHHRSLEKAGLSVDDLKKLLTKHGIEKVSDCFFALTDNDGMLRIQKKEKKGSDVCMISMKGGGKK